MDNMRRKFRVIFVLILLLAVGGACLVLTSCNKNIVDLQYLYNWAQIAMPDGSVIEGNVDSWVAFSNSSMRVTINGVVYLTHSENVVLCSEKP